MYEPIAGRRVAACLGALAAIGLIAVLPACKGSGGGGGGGGTVPTPVPGRATRLYSSAGVVPGLIVNLGATRTGTVTPSSAISSSVLHFGDNFSLLYASDKLWVTSCMGLPSSFGPLLAFNPAADGTTVTPLINIQGSATGLGSCQQGVALDSSSNVYVTDLGTVANPGGQVSVFAAGLQGNIAPLRVIGGALANFHSPAGLAFDSAGNLYVAQTGQGYGGAFPGGISVFAPGARGNVAPLRTISGTATRLNGTYSLAFDGAGNLYASNPNGNSITVYAPGASGNALPIRTIAGTSTLLASPAGIAIDAAGYLYVGNQNLSASSTPILVFAPNVNGNAAPVQRIVVDSPRFQEPSGIAIK